MAELITHARLKEMMNYNPGTGIFTWRVTFSHTKAGSLAGTDRGDGYLVCKIDQRQYRLHRLAWLYVHGRWPPKLIDHKNGKRADNRIKNLREATGSQNIANSARRRTNASGFKGVHHNGYSWIAQIHVGRKHFHLGCYDHPETARDAYMAAAIKHFGEFARAE